MTSENDPVSSCITVIKRAKNDTEKIAALFLVTKAVNAQHTNTESRQRLLDAIGLPFLFRLLSTKEKDEDISDYQVLAVTIISSLCIDSDMVSDEHFLSRLELFIPILGARDRKDSVLSDCFQILDLVATTFEGCQALINHNCIEHICDNICHPDSGKAESVLLRLINTCGEDVWVSCPKVSDQLMIRWTDCWIKDKSHKKFHYCQILAPVVTSLPKSTCQNQPWVAAMIQELCEILSCKLGSKMMSSTLSLGASLLDKLGIHHVMDDFLDGRKFFFLLSHLCSIEIVMIFDSLEEVSNSTNLLIYCYGVMETLLYYLITSDICCKEEIAHLHRALEQAINSILFYLIQVSQGNHQISDDFLYATMRLVGAWMAEETSEMKNLVTELLPYFLQISRKTLTKLQYNFSHQSQDPDSAVCLPNMNVPDVSRFLLPGLCHLSAEDQPRAILLKQDLLRFLRDYTFYHWKIFKGDKAEDSSLALRTIFGIFLNLAILEPQRVSADPIFLEIFHFIAESVTQIEPDHNLLKANFVTVGLMLLRHLPEGSSHESREFLSEAVNFLLGAHQSTPSGSQLSLAYKNVWEDLQELWLLGMQVLTALIPTQPILKLICKKSHQVFIKDLLNCTDFDVSISEAYEGLLKGIGGLHLNAL